MKRIPKTIEKYSQEISKLPKGYISKKVIKGKIKTYLQWNEKGKKISKYINPTQLPIVSKQIERRKFLSTLIDNYLGCIDACSTSNPYLTTMFLSQSYKDTWEDYIRTLSDSNFPCWDYVVLTASNASQCLSFEKQIELRKNGGFLPSKTRFICIPDRDGKRVGSGGATLSVLKKIFEIEKTFKNIKILVIHSGGDSKRVPQYSALGKLFSPVPHLLPDGRLSTLFDEFIISMSSMANRIREGMLLLSGDVLLLFNPLQIDFSNCGAACISFKENVNIGKNHGVYLKGQSDFVQKCLQKQSIDDLKKAGAINENNMVDIDTGAILFGPDLLSKLYQLIDTDEKYDKYVNDKVRLSLYADFLYPLAIDSTLESFYKEKPEGKMCSELLETRKTVWDLLSPFKMKLLQLAPAKFIHFGTTKEVLNLMNKGVEEYSVLGWSNNVGCSFNNSISGYNAAISKSCKIGKNCYLETSYVHHKATIGNNVALSYIDVNQENIPDNVVVHGLKLNNGKFVVRIYGVEDNPKENKLFGFDIGEPLWTANIYPVKETIKDALKASLNLYEIITNGSGNKDVYDKEDKISLADGFNMADPESIIEWDERMKDLVRMEKIMNLIGNNSDVNAVKGMLNKPELSKIQKEWLEKRIANEDTSLSLKIRLYYYIGVALGSNGSEYIKLAFKEISNSVLSSSVKQLHYDGSLKPTRNEIAINMPLRVNFGGGWSDTPPYCNENGGTVLNCSLLLNGKKPVEVTIKRIKEHKIIFESKDMDVYGEFISLSDLQDTGDPYDSFALQKAALLSVGVIPFEGGNIDELFDRFDGGFYINSEVRGVPKGSGLGTSSILSAAVVKALFEFFGIQYDDAKLFQTVLVMEQIMSTGGGWQDQVGGAVPGFKLITSKPGIEQKLDVKYLNIPKETLDELNERFCLIYTGERRLARNLLRDVVGRYIGNVKESVDAHKQIQVTALKMTEALEKGDLERFIKLYDKHFSLSLKIDAESSNILIDQIFTSIEELISAKMICGAGGGGFVTAILKKGVTKQQVHERLKSIFQDFPVDVWDAKLI